ncbi:transporter, SSS family [Daejeonella rubra]|uniref:Transporter, SSS family n=1 Tax=Daejeonella rubra TaxID=990371 RepID=A0A1G9QRT1_9SPHI|nr:sodium:solute symporter family protein [Daejeonella rubra]SDM12975.1 transporter, SSS family [Daejeonella rubra]
MSPNIDTIVIFVFSAFVLCIGLVFSRTGINLKSFFAGGESVPWFIGGLSLFMSFFSAGTFVAWGSIAYKYGWVAITIQWTMCIGAIISGMYLAPLWKSTGNLTAAEFIKERLGLRVQKTYIYIFMLVSLFIKGTVLYPVAKLVSGSLGYPLVPSTIVLGIFMITYTAVGGLWAVMVTDILQFVILTAAVLIILPLAFDAAGGAAQFQANAQESFFDLLNGEFTLGFIIAFTLYHIFYIGGNWTFVQRYTSVKDNKSAKKVAYLFAALYLISPVLWMLPPMIYKTINPSLTGLDTENAYLMICQLVLPPGLLGLMLTGMYFSTSASANTTLNVVSAVFTNDIYKGRINPEASDRKLMKIARLSSWLIGIGMILIALLVPFIGGLVNVTISVGAITGGPILAPPIWALFSKRLNGRDTLIITYVSLGINLLFKIVLPFMIEFKLSRAEEMLVGVGIPLILLIANELRGYYKAYISPQYIDFQVLKNNRIAQKANLSAEEVSESLKQNKFGLKITAFALAFTAFLLMVLGLVTGQNIGLLSSIAFIILVLSIIPWRASQKILVHSAD